jgi:transposase
MSNLYWLSEDQMARLRPYFPKSHGVPRVDDRRVLSGIIINRNGLRWCDAPKEYGPPKTLYNRGKWWSDMGVFARIMTGLAAEAPDHKPLAQVKPDEALQWSHPRYGPPWVSKP